MNQQLYLQVLKKLRDSVWDKTTSIWTSGNWFLHPDNAPTYTALSVQYFLAKKHDGYPSSSLFARPYAMGLFAVPLYERPDGREMFC